MYVRQLIFIIQKDTMEQHMCYYYLSCLAARATKTQREV